MKRHGFTLIEMLLVIALMAIISGAAALKLTHSLRLTTAEQAVKQTRELDQLARARAKQGGMTTQLVIRFEKDQLAYRDSADAVDHASIQLGNSHVAEVVVADDRTTSGEVAINCSAEGYTPNYSICVSDADLKQRWFQVFGLTGTATITDDPKEADKFIEAIGKGRDDTH